MNDTVRAWDYRDEQISRLTAENARYREALTEAAEFIAVDGWSYWKYHGYKLAVKLHGVLGIPLRWNLIRDPAEREKAEQARRALADADEGRGE